ncbi:hypothetical protein [Candidatus Endomicrobiellum trichonymphae]|uniref:hypothetical protein n=1 Tax=Endomicrobium trichonymphae TaxID=1408204 RepID=UPI0008659FF1|nr:hypothetical protein [Candidatus Endomicrobium trichonymphae]BAV59079.1 hypothetical protein RSTT_499 [Candidatus Endomicrobium trichonymphae]
MKKGILAFVVSVFVLSFVSCDKTSKLCGTENEVKAEEAKNKEYDANKKLFLNKEFGLLEEKTVPSADLEKWFKEEYGIEYSDIKVKTNVEQKAKADYIATVKEKEQKKQK